MLFLLSINVLNLFIPDKDFSELENRMLSQAPKFSMKNLISGRFTSKFEEYITDQFAFRDFWVAVKSDIERLILKTKNNGIFFGKDGYLLEDYQKPDRQLMKNINKINVFANRLPNVATHLLLVPNSVKIYEDKLPLFASPYDQLATITNVKKHLNQNVDFIDVYNTLTTKKDEYIYFKTDHHWTMRAAFYAYQKSAKHLGIKPYSLSDFNTEIVTNSFYGTFYSKANNRHIPPDAIEIFKPKFAINYQVYYEDANKFADKLYEYNYLDKKDKYSLFDVLVDNHRYLSCNISNLAHEFLHNGWLEME